MIPCFLCKQKIKKSGALEHSKICKPKPIKKKTKNEEGYSPIKERESEENSKVYSSSEDNYSSYKFEDSNRG